VAYSTGEVGLVSPGEFAELDLTGFTDLRTLKVGETEKAAAPNEAPATPFGHSTVAERAPPMN
jgi:hypothetical protein